MQVGILVPDVLPGWHLGSRCFTRVPGNSGGGCLSAMRCLGKQQCGTHGRHVGREDWRRGPAFRKLWPGSCPFPIAYHTWVDVWGRPSEVGALGIHLELGLLSSSLASIWLVLRSSQSEPGKVGARSYHFLAQNL